MGCAGSTQTRLQTLDPHDSKVSSLKVVVESATNIPSGLLTAADASVAVTVRVSAADASVAGTGRDTTKGNAQTRTQTKRISSSSPEWQETLDCGNVHQSDEISFSLKDGSTVLGTIELTVGEFCKRPRHTFLLSDKEANMLVKDSVNPTTLTLSFDRTCMNKSWASSQESVVDIGPNGPSPNQIKQHYKRHVMMITRGTRGDVQPFVALARGLAQTHDWLVTIVTELRWKDFVKKNAVGLTQGAVVFRPSGGDSMKLTEGSFVKWFMQCKSEVAQLVSLAGSEMVFFESEPIFYYWASLMKPDCIVYAFTVANIALILADALQIPIIGFVLQPTCIPSVAYLPVVPIDSHAMNFIDSLEESVSTHTFQAKMKAFFENNPISGKLNNMRARRELPPFPSQYNVWEMIVKLDLPLIVPISERCFGGKPPEWNNKACLTEFIFLQGGAVPKLDSKMVEFIAIARKNNRKVVVMAFSSMPVSRASIMNIVIKICKECEKPCSVIALVAADREQGALPSNINAQIEELTLAGHLFEAAGAPFSLLFNEVDCCIVHGGLGTTADALRAGKPCMVTGCLLMDQRFWGSRVESLGVGPALCHIQDFPKVCVDNVNKCLADDSIYAKKAKELAGEIIPKSPDGVQENVEAISRFIESESYDAGGVRLSQRVLTFFLPLDDKLSVDAEPDVAAKTESCEPTATGAAWTAGKAQNFEHVENLMHDFEPSRSPAKPKHVNKANDFVHVENFMDDFEPSLGCETQTH